MRRVLGDRVGLSVQPRADHCRRRMENHLEQDIRVKSAKVRLGERSRMWVGEGMAESKVLKDLEAAMREEDPEKLKEFFEDCRQESSKGRPSPRSK